MYCKNNKNKQYEIFRNNYCIGVINMHSLLGVRNRLFAVRYTIDTWIDSITNYNTFDFADNRNLGNNRIVLLT